MAHEVETMVYCQDTPWHGLGDFLGDIDGVSMDSLKESHPIYFSELSPEPLFTATGAKLDGYYALTRSFDGKLVGHGGEQLIQGVTEPWRVMQAVDNILGTGRAVIHTAGFLRGGTSMWVLCKLVDEPIRVKGTEDAIEQYLLTTVAFDGSMSMTYLWTPTRVVCANTQRMALQGAAKGDAIRVKQTRNAESRRQDAEELIRSGLEFYQEIQVKYDALADVKLADSQVEDILRRSFSVKPDAVIGTRTQNNMDEVKRLTVEGVNSDDATMLSQFEGSAYSLWQGLTAYADHSMVVRGARSANDNPDTPEKRAKVLDSIWFGAAASFRAKAWDAVNAVALGQ